MGEAEVSSFADLGVAQSLSNYLAGRPLITIQICNVGFSTHRCR